MSEHEFEPVRGLPERLPPGESILWQGTPDWRSLAVRAFHARALAVYFTVLLVWRGASALADGATVGEATSAVLFLLPFAGAAVALACVMAWLSARATVYTITDRRVVMRLGIVLEVTFNLPYRAIDSAGLFLYRGGTGDIPLVLSADDRIAYAHLWPHARPWRFARPEPMLRCVPDAASVARLLGRALALDVDAANDARADRAPALRVAQ